MFGGGYRVGVSVTPVEVLPWPEPPTGVVARPSRLAEVLPPAERNDAEIAADLGRITEIEAALAAYRVALVTELAARRPAAADTPGGAPEPGDVDEFFADELAVVLNCSRTAASVLYEQSRTLTERLPVTVAALADGALDWPRARVLATELGRPADDTNPRIIAEVEAAVLPRAAALSIRRLTDAVRAELVARDAAAAELRRRLAEKTADVKLRPVGDGMAELVSGHRTERAAAMLDTVDQLAWMLKKDGDLRPIGVLRAQVLEDLVLRPWDLCRPAVTAQLTIVAPLAALGGTVTPIGDAAPTGTVNGTTITATHLKELLTELDMLGLRAPDGGGIGIALVDADGRLLATATPGELQRLARRGCPHHPDPTTGNRRTRRRRRRRGNLPGGPAADPGATTTLDGTSGCGCPVLDLPPGVDRYRPTPAQRRFVATRDRTCRHPGCRNEAGWADHDHVLPHAEGGPTDCTNLCCLCRRHHRLKTHARGWIFRMDPDGTLFVTTPSGVTRVTRPPGLRPQFAPPANGLLGVLRAGGHPTTSAEPSDSTPSAGDLPPF
jgi:hypothetical protein